VETNNTPNRPALQMDGLYTHRIDEIFPFVCQFRKWRQ